jgi:hypothetical protein
MLPTFILKKQKNEKALRENTFVANSHRGTPDF